MERKRADKIIIGAGLYGLYAALFCCRRGESVVVLECEDAPFTRATYINQARVHNGYHYPRSLSTAMKSAGYFRRFNEDYGFCVNRAFDQIYATSSRYSWTDRAQFKAFCRAAGIPCEELVPGAYFKDGLCDGAFRTTEYTYDAKMLLAFFMEELGHFKNSCDIRYGFRISDIRKDGRRYVVSSGDGQSFEAGFVLNAAYAGTNQILAMAGFEPFKIKYELCEIILCDAGEALRDVGFTVMDGPFFSIMPFGKTGFHSLTAVAFTPHTACKGPVPVFPCQEKTGGRCSETFLANCNACPERPESAYPYMSSLAHKYLLDKYNFSYRQSLYSMKPILLSSEIDDSRPTVIRLFGKDPTFAAVLSGKINTVYDLDEVLSDG